MLALLVLPFGGCLGPRREGYTVRQSVSMADTSEESDRLWESIQDVLRRRGFRLDRVDRSAGVVTTYPVGSQHFFEVWRRDVNTLPDWLESSMNPIRRWVEVEVSRSDGGAWEELAVVVHKERLSTPDRQFNNSVAAFKFFDDSLPSTTGKPRVGPEEDRWLDRGRDPAMEEFLLREILRRAGVEFASASDSGSASVEGEGAGLR